MIIFILPFVPAGVPWNDEFTWSAFNYAPVMVGLVVIAVGVWWLISAKNTFTGPIRQIETDDTGRVIGEKPLSEGLGE